MKDKLNTITEQVFLELSAFPETRNDDFLLQLRVWIDQYGLKETDTIGDVMRRHKELNLPAWDSASRARRKLQAELPHLRASEPVKSKRAEAEHIYHDWAINK